MVRTVKVGVVAALIVVTGLALLWVTEAVPRSDIEDVAPKAIGAVAVLVIAGFVWSLLRGSSREPDDTDKPVP